MRNKEGMSMEDKNRELFLKLQSILKPSRYEHTLGVAYTASNLAMRYHADMNQAFLAGLLHDNAKSISDDELLTFCENYNIEVTPTERVSKYLLHAKVGAYHVKHTYHIEDQEIANAVYYHTTGRPNMSLLEKIIFTADYIEPNRKIIPGLDEIRQVVYLDLDEAVYLICRNTLNYLKSKQEESTIEPMTVKTYEFYKDIHDRKQK